MATPIGNLQDITLRALETLKSVDVIAAEDTRVSRKLTGHFGIQARIVSAHEHNERESARGILALLAEGKSVALVTDAGTPTVSDPGAIVVARVREAGFRVVPVPGASAVMAALAASGLAGESFCFHGFLPARKGERAAAFDALKASPGLQVFFEAPHRVVESVRGMASALGGERRIVIARELTKMFEQINECRLDEAADWLAADDNRQRGEFVLVVEGCESRERGSATDTRRMLEVLMRELPLRRAVDVAAEISGEKKNALYEAALAMRNEKGTQDDE